MCVILGQSPPGLESGDTCHLGTVLGLPVVAESQTAGDVVFASVELLGVKTFRIETASGCAPAVVSLLSLTVS